MKQTLFLKVLLTVAAIKVAGVFAVALHLYAQHTLATTPYELMPIAGVIMGFCYMAMPAVLVGLIVALVEIWSGRLD